MPTTAGTMHIPPRVAGYQKWRDLLFLHWSVPADELQQLLPPRLIVQTFEGRAWVGLVAFHMLGVRPWWCTAVPGVSAFHETNVRTYVTRDGEDPGVWFFSLDAASSLAVRIARWRWHLNYYRSALRISRKGTGIAYAGRRLWPGTAVADYAIDAQVPTGTPEAPAAAGSIEQFLVERYAMYAQRRDGALYRGEVRHPPYPLRPAQVTACSESLLAAAGIAVDGPPEHSVFSPGVDVAVCGLQPCAPRSE